MHKNAWKHKAIYHILLDRFAGDIKTKDPFDRSFIGGTINGVTKSIPYLKSLGINVVWISPFTKSLSYHAYNTTDFYSVDPHFGTEKDLKHLIDTVHKNGMEIICDFVPNHTSVDHPFFVDARTNPKSQYRDWYHFKKWPYKYEKFLNFGDLAKLNLDNPDAMKHLQGAAHKWLSLGFDGLRLDHIIGLSNTQVIELLSPLREDFPKAIFIGEAWFSGLKFGQVNTLRVPRRYLMWLLWALGDNSNNLLYKNYEGILDGVLDFNLMRLFNEYADAKTESKRKNIEREARRESTRFAPDLLQFTFLDNHDMERFLFRVENDTEKLERTAELQFSLDQPAIIYYGSEVGMTQIQAFSDTIEYSDLLARQPMIWDKKRQDAQVLDFYKRIIKKKTTES